MDEAHQPAVNAICEHLLPILNDERGVGNSIDYSEVSDDGKRVMIRMYYTWADPPPEAHPPVRYRKEEFFCTEHKHRIQASRTTRPHRDPEWWTQALELEKQDRLEEAEELVTEAMRKLGTPWPAQLAHLYELRMRRLSSEGASDEKILEARNKAIDWMDLYASGATSGGEGAALSYQAKQFRKQLGAE